MKELCYFSDSESAYKAIFYIYDNFLKTHKRAEKVELTIGITEGSPKPKDKSSKKQKYMIRCFYDSNTEIDYIWIKNLCESKDFRAKFNCITNN